MLPPVTLSAPRILLAAAIALAGAAIPAAAKDLAASELRALRYYVEQGDTRSAEAEVRRLRALHPDWTPPADLSSLRDAPQAAAGPGEEADRIWKLIEIGNWSAARGRLDHLTATHPTWQPPAEMVRLITVGEAQAQFDSAVNSGAAATAIEVARRTPTILRCDRVNNAWQLAVMQQKAGDTAGALTTYRGVLGSCTDGSVIVATLEKANSIASESQIRDLANFARQSRPAVKPSIDMVEQRLLAGRGVAAAPAQAAPSAPAPQPAAPAPVTAAAPQPVQPTPTPAPAPAPAIETVQAAPTRAVPLTSLPPSGDSRVNAVRVAARAGDWGNCLAQSTNPRSVEVLYERAWCAMNRNRSLEALAAFRVASTAPLGATVQRDARFGMILAFLENQMTEDAARLAAVTNLTEEQRIEVETIILDQRGVRSFQTKDYAGTVNYLNALEQLNGSIRRDLAIMRAYAYLNQGQRGIAREQFEKLHNQLATNETRKGLNAAMQ